MERWSGIGMEPREAYSILRGGIHGAGNWLTLTLEPAQVQTPRKTWHLSLDLAGQGGLLVGDLAAGVAAGGGFEAAEEGVAALV